MDKDQTSFYTVFRIKVLVSNCLVWNPSLAIHFQPHFFNQVEILILLHRVIVNTELIPINYLGEHLEISKDSKLLS